MHYFFNQSTSIMENTYLFAIIVGLRKHFLFSTSSSLKVKQLQETVYILFILIFTLTPHGLLTTILRSSLLTLKQLVLTTLYNVCAVPWGGGGVFSTVGISWVPWGSSWVPWGISWVPWGLFSTMRDTILWNLSTVGDIMIHVGDIMSTVGVFSTVGYSNNKRFPPPTILNTPTVLMISPTVLSIPHGIQDNPYGTHDSSHSTEHSHSTQDISPHLSWYPPWYWTPPRYSRYSPMVLMISSTVLKPPQYWAPPLYCTHIIQGVNCRITSFNWLTSSDVPFSLQAMAIFGNC